MGLRTEREAVDDWPGPDLAEAAAIVERRLIPVSPWVSLVEKTVAFPHQEEPQVYHSLRQAETVGVLALTESGRVPLVGQYRPAVEQFIWELPAGMVDEGESPETCCRRELEEETGLRAREVVPLNQGWPDSGRLDYRHHAWFARTSDPDPAFRPEPGTEVAFVRPDTLLGAIVSGRFSHQLHVAIVCHGLLRGLLPAQGWTPCSEAGA